MKTMRRVFALVLCLTLALTLAVPAMAAGEAYQYEIYQIFKGDYNEDAKVLTNIKWGKNGTGTYDKMVENTILDELEAIDAATSDANKLATIKKYVDLDTTPFAHYNTNDTTFELTLAEDGYYLIKDVANTQSGEGQSYTTYMVKVIDGKLKMTRKADNIIPDKFIDSDDYNDNNGVDDSVTTDGKTNNAGVGNKVNFELTVKLPVNAAGYTYYYCVLNDTMSKGLTFDPSSVVVTVEDGSGNVEKTLVKDTDYKLYTGTETITYDHDNNDTTPNIHYTFQMALMDAKAYPGKTIVMNYSATVNKDAVIGVEGNPNEFNVTYSNDPNYAYDDVNKNGRPDVDDHVPIGDTPVKKTVTYVTGIKLIKVDEHGNALTGAEFTIDGDSIKYVLTTQDQFKPETTEKPGDYYKLLNGAGTADDTYTLTAPQTEVKYEPAAPGATAGYVNMGTTDEPIWVEYVEADHPGKQIYVKILPNDDLYEKNAEGTAFLKYYKETVYHVRGDDANELPATVAVGGDGIAHITGLGEGVYTITESKVPAGYNKIEDITLTIDWTAPADFAADTDCTWTASAAFGTSGTTNLTLNADGVFELEVENRSGSNLPETGGMGTTLFYVFGGIMVLAAVVLLVTKKRMVTAE